LVDTNQIIGTHHHESFFNARQIDLLMKVPSLDAESNRASTLRTDFNCALYFVTRAWNRVENWMLLVVVVVVVVVTDVAPSFDDGTSRRDTSSANAATTS
jgi:hypothetical protein